MPNVRSYSYISLVTFARLLESLLLNLNLHIYHASYATPRSIRGHSAGRFASDLQNASIRQKKVRYEY